MKLVTAKNLSIPLKIALVIVGSVLLAVSSKITIPFYPVPMTMQVFAVIMIALLLPPRLAIATAALYLFEGAVGLPVFADTPARGIGISYMVGPTGGYLVGFLACIAFVSITKEKFSGLFQHLMISSIGLGIIYALGMLWLGSVIGWDKPLLVFGFYPFILGDALKVLLAVLVAHGATRLLSPPRNS